MTKPRRILGLTFNGKPIFEPSDKGCSLTFAPPGGGKTTSVAMPTSLLIETGSATFVSDIRSDEIAAQLSALGAASQRCYLVVDEFSLIPLTDDHRDGGCDD